jgi:hypothetical protein
MYLIKKEEIDAFLNDKKRDEYYISDMFIFHKPTNKLFTNSSTLSNIEINESLDDIMYAVKVMFPKTKYLFKYIWWTNV